MVKSNKKIGWLFIAMKSTKLVKAFKVIKAVKFMKPAIMLGSMLLSLLVYGFAFGWVFAVGLIAMIFIHEMGHVIAMKMKGFPTKAPVFIPMLGAVIFGPKQTTREEESFIAIGGPILGTIGALIAWLIWLIHPEHPIVWLMMSYIGIFLNLFNMIPISPFDGGRITQSIGPWFKWVGMALLMALTLMTRDPGLLVIWIIVIIDIDTIKLSRKKHLSLAILMLLVTATALGLGTQDRWVYFFDIFLGCGFTANIWINGRENLEQVGEAERNKNGSSRPQQTMKRKMGWLVAFVGLTVLLISSLAIQAKTIQPWVEEQKAKEQPIPPPQVI